MARGDRRRSVSGRSKKPQKPTVLESVANEHAAAIFERLETASYLLPVGVPRDSALPDVIAKYADENDLDVTDLHAAVAEARELERTYEKWIAGMQVETRTTPGKREVKTLTEAAERRMLSIKKRLASDQPMNIQTRLRLERELEKNEALLDEYFHIANPGIVGFYDEPGEPMPREYKCVDCGEEITKREAFQSGFCEPCLRAYKALTGGHNPCLT